ncbi:30S ribosomal protein S3 [Candidatus Gracilibacteria bacterium]|nr:30S ribosomal protein S3 [bacterium]NDK19549.1 30S ribosomal protein S3 [Candidatus Gracilibacteria bacterium]OIO77885.1 MAG: 30S ribosomal protein S3 [Candidatus Gracilibacteria bacterium CG1_02_38_174]PIQ11926.1 MAG: 30S ribosomal protein S3 [Candidatus Gracilibacteria bacterium CG18_big_fil_WC_8_21_14_2_50_38_16]PIQ41245.1 MAG: 30S ribosomal protein S3 [Candidatus Gracilibacteria bacterium CG12_big_fil_rev_8_21_14_0_65_38_15]PIZ01846.1 MAG: 30S ribosomal protein S3 [Candidatus Gracilibac
MGHKVSPLAFRIGYIKTWKSTGYYNKKDYGKKIASDVALRIFVQKFLTGIPVGNVFINHTTSETTITIYTAKTALVLGKNDENKEKLEQEIATRFPGKFVIEVKEVKKPELSAALVADSIARQIEKKLPYRRVIKNAISKTMEKGGLGIKVILGGRLNGAEIARVETYKEGAIPRQTIRADIDYSLERANTIYGVIGLKVWIYKGDIYKK